MTAAFKEYTGKSLNKSKKPSVRRKLELAKERVAKAQGAGKDETEGTGAGALSGRQKKKPAAEKKIRAVVRKIKKHDPGENASRRCEASGNAEYPLCDCVLSGG